MPVALNRAELLRVVRGLPQGCTLEEAVYRINLWAAIQEGLESLREYGGISHDEVVAYFRKKPSRRPTCLAPHQSDIHKPKPGSRKRHGVARSQGSEP